MTDHVDSTAMDALIARQVAAGNGWTEIAERALGYLEATGDPFSADDFHELMAGAPAPTHHNAVGSLFNQHRRRGLITVVGYGPSTRKRRNGGIRRIWVGTYRPVSVDNNGDNDKEEPTAVVD